MMNRRQLFAGLLAAPIAAAASCTEPEPKPSPRKVTRVITVPGKLPQEVMERMARSIEFAIENDKVLILEDGATYHEFYGEPVPIQFADGGIIDPDKVPGLTFGCTHPMKIIERPKPLPSRHAGDVTITVKCDSSEFERDMDRIEERIRKMLFLKNMLRGFRFCRGLQNIGLTYTAGYSSMPLDLKQAAIEAFALTYRQRTHIGEKSNSMGGQVTLAFDMSDVPPRSLNIFNQYRRLAPAS